jgi:hypothetical protein
MRAHVFTSVPAGRGGNRRGLIPVLCVSLLCAWAQVPAAPRQDKPEKGKGEEENVTVKLRADVQAGFSPLALTFTGRIKNMGLDDDRFCHAGTLLLRKMVTGSFETVAGEDPACLHGPEKREISPTFSIRHVILDPGTYEFFAMVVTKDGRRITSNGVPVRVVAGVPQ